MDGAKAPWLARLVSNISASVPSRRLILISLTDVEACWFLMGKWEEMRNKEVYETDTYDNGHPLDFITFVSFRASKSTTLHFSWIQSSR